MRPTLPISDKGRLTMMRFSNWVKFDQRDELRNTNSPGVYAIAISPMDIAGTQFNWTKEISYFGFINSVGGLRGRLNQFNNTLRDKSGPGDGGAQRFRRKYRRQRLKNLVKLPSRRVISDRADV